VLIILGVVLVLALLYVGFPLLVAAVDLVIVILLGLVGLVSRVAFRRPWDIEARASDGSTSSWRVVGWRASGRRLAEIKQALGAGTIPGPDDGATAGRT
jgi:hypothetical protein